MSWWQTRSWARLSGWVAHQFTHNLPWLEDNPGGRLSGEGNPAAGSQAGPEFPACVLHFSSVSSREETDSVSNGGNSGREQLKPYLR